MNWLLVGAIVLNLTFSMIGDICAKLWGTTGVQSWLYVGMLINVATIFFFMYAIRLGGLGVVTAVVLTMTILLNVVIGFWMFNEQVQTIQWVGIGLGLVSVLLVSNVFKVGL